MRRCNFYLTALLASIVSLLSGCADFVTVQAKADTIRTAAPTVAATTSELLVKAEPVFGALEDATGTTLSDATISKGESIATKTAAVADKIRNVSAVISAIPGPQAPFTGALTAVAGAVAGVAGAMGAFLARRRERKATRALDTALVAGVEADHFGREVTKAAAAMGTSELIEARYAASGAKLANDAYPES